MDENRPRGRVGRRNQLGPVQRITVNLPVREHRLLVIMSEQTGREMSDIVRAAVRKEVDLFLTSGATTAGRKATDGDGEEPAA